MDGTIDIKSFGKDSESRDINALYANEISSQIHLPGGDMFLSADFVRQGYDLTLKTPDGQVFTLPDYFMTDTPPDLLLGDGSVITADLATKLAGPMTPGQSAQQQIDPQAEAQATLGSAIGSVSELEGSVLATRADGTQVTLNAGDPIFQGDVLETGASSTLGVIFADDTTFSLDAGGRMVIDEMVYDPDAQVGVFEATVVKGVFSFVSGQVAKTGADAMVVSTPKTTIGIRGSTGLIKSGAEDGEDHITLVPDIDGNLGELVVSNQAGSQVLNQPNASTTVFSATQPPAPVVLMSAQQIQQNYGGALTVLVRTEAKKAVAKVEHAARKAQDAADKAFEQQNEADQAEEEATQAEDDAAEAQAEAEAAIAEAEAAKAEAGALTSAEAKAAAAAKIAAAEAKAQEAQAKAALVAQAAAVKAAEAAAKAAAALEATQQAAEAAAAQQIAQKFSQMAGSAAEIQQQVFTKFMETGIVDPAFMPGAPAPGSQQGGPNAPNSQGGPDGNPDGGPDAGDAAAEAAYQAAIEAGATPEEAFNAAALAATGGNLDDPAVDAARAAFEEALANGASPQEAMLAAQNAAQNFVVEGVAPPPQPIPVAGPGMIVISPTGEAFTMSADGQMIIVSQNGSTTTGVGLPTNFVDAAAIFNETFNDVYNTYVETTQTAVTADDGQATTVTTDDDYVNTDFSETITAVSGGGNLAGGSGSTNFYFPWASLESGTGGTYTITDTGGVNQLSFDGMNDVEFFVTASTSTAGSITVYKDPNGTPASFATISYSGISQFLLADVTVSSFATNNFTTTSSGTVLKLSSLSAGQSAFGMAGTTGNDTISLSSSHDSVVFGKDGDDAFTISGTGSVQILGGAGADHFTVNAWGGTNGGYVLTGGDGADHYDYSSWSTPPSLYVYITSSGSVVQDVATGSTATHTHSFEMTSADTFTGTSAADYIHVYSGYAGIINGSGGNDTITVKADFFTRAADPITLVDGGTGTNTLNINADSGDTFNLQTYVTASKIANFSSYAVTGVSSATAVTLTGLSSASTTLDGSASNDSLTGGSAADVLRGQDGNDTLTGGGGGDTLQGGIGNDTLIGGAGVDTLTGGTGADIFRYESTTDGPDTLMDFNGQTTFASATGEGDTFAFLNSAFNLGTLSYVEQSWGGTANNVVGGSVAGANVIVLTGAQGGTLAEALTGIATAGGSASPAIIVFNDSNNSNYGTVAYTTDASAGSSPQTLAVFNGVTADMAALSSADFTFV